jgi:hypothetical protein
MARTNSCKGPIVVHFDATFRAQPLGYVKGRSFALRVTSEELDKDKWSFR